MIDFDGMAFQIAALEIRQSIGKKDTKLCKTKCAAKLAQSTETAKHFSTVKISTTETSTAPTSTKAPIVIMWNNEWRAGITTIDCWTWIPDSSVNRRKEMPV
uniref:Uncharacterized protein n=1 Tax=Globodera pallida TaxID=36090 RepID=A0A183CS15_GLOPA